MICILRSNLAQAPFKILTKFKKKMKVKRKLTLFQLVSKILLAA